VIKTWTIRKCPRGGRSRSSLVSRAREQEIEEAARGNEEARRG